MSDKDTLWDKTVTNFRHFGREIKEWQRGMYIPWLQFKHAKGLSSRLHKLMNLWKESFALLPYTLSHFSAYALIIWGGSELYSIAPTIYNQAMHAIAYFSPFVKDQLAQWLVPYCAQL